MAQQKGFIFEDNLPHQTKPVNAVLAIFEDVKTTTDNQQFANVVNPHLHVNETTFKENLAWVQEENSIDFRDSQYQNFKNFTKEPRILDISMETGTGKTYIYTKTIFELNKALGLFKFIVVVPTVSIRAGTMNFLNSDTAKDHFKQIYDKEIKPIVLESQPKRKNKRNFMPQAINEFVRAQDDGQSLYILVVNQGMINSTTMRETFDQLLLDNFGNPFEAVASLKPVLIVDEPHRFRQQKVTWQRLLQFKPQFIIRYGATFPEYENLLHELTAVDAFNQDLVKGITTYVEEYSDAENTKVTLIKTDTKEAVFELKDHDKKQTFKLTKNESLAKIHEAMLEVIIEKHNTREVELSNGVILKKNDSLNPYSFAMALQDKMIAKAIQNHFKLEQDLLTRDVKIKPLTLFFIDNIAEYRLNKDEAELEETLKLKIETLIQREAKKYLKTEDDPFYRRYLETTLQDVSLTHGGYFSQDNTDSDDKVAKEVEEILHDKEALLRLDNPRRFIFSKWTLREGWDNPNVFQICKLRSSGSEISKLQEVGRGLRLPVNEYMGRVKDEPFYLNYYVDFSEKDFAEKLVGEINEKSGSITPAITELDSAIIEKLLTLYPNETEESILENLDEKNAITRSNNFKKGGYETFIETYPKILEGNLKPNKVRKSTDHTLKATMRVGKYDELKALWEEINQQVILEYQVENEEKFYDLLHDYFSKNLDLFKPQGSRTRARKLRIHEDEAYLSEEAMIDEEILPFAMMGYSDFLLELSRKLMVNRNTLHRVFINLQNQLDINHYLSHSTIRKICNSFARYLLDHAFTKFQLSYKAIHNRLHPTVLTNKQGEPYKKLNSGNFGRFYDDKLPADNYLFNEIFYDSELECKNILEHITDVTVFTKIPKNSIKIPVAGGLSYSPDFAYVVKTKEGQKQINLIVETKGHDAKRDLTLEEQQKIKHAEKLFKKMGKDINIHFKTQFNEVEIVDLITELL